MSESAVVSLGDERFRPITDLTFPAMREYAQRIGASFEVIQDRKFPDVNICYEKLQLGSALKKYRRILYLDGDVLVRTGAPSIFDVVPYGYFAGMNELEHIRFWTRQMLGEQVRPYGGIDLNGRHFNAGVMVMDQSHARLFEAPIITNLPYWDQPYFNVFTQVYGFPFYSLPPEWNFMVNHEYNGDKESLMLKAHFLHFAGTTMTPAEKAIAIARVNEDRLG